MEKYQVIEEISKVVMGISISLAVVVFIGVVVWTYNTIKNGKFSWEF